MELKFTDGLILLGLFRHGTDEGDGRVYYEDTLRALVPKASEDALTDALARLVASGYVRSEERQRRPSERGRVPRRLSAAWEFTPEKTPELSDQGSFRGKNPGNAEPEPSRAHAGLTAAAAAHPYYPGILRVFRIEGVVDPEQQISAYRVPACLGAISELRARRRTHMPVSRPAGLLVHFAEKYHRIGAPEVPNPELVLADWADDAEGANNERVRAIK